MVEVIEYKGEVLENGQISLPREIFERVRGKKTVKVVLYVKDGAEKTHAADELKRMPTAMAEYQSKYPDDDVTLL